MDKKTLLTKICDALGITKDEAKKLVQDAEPPPPPPAATDAMGGGYDAIMKAIKDLNAAVSSMTSPTTAAVTPDADKMEGKEDKTGDDDQVESSIEGRMKKLEAAVASILEKMSMKAGDANEDEPVVMDEDMEEGEAEDADMDEEESEDAEGCTGDTASRVEILAPGLEAKGKGIKAKALKACYDSKEGKKIIEMLNGGKAPAWDSKEKIALLFNAASEVLKASRNRDLSKTKQVRDAELVEGTPYDRVMTPEKMNELNAKHYSQRS